MSCIFCEIVKGTIPSYKVWENERVFAFLDIHPIRPGHVLVIPKKHEPDFYKLDIPDYEALMGAVKEIAEIVNNKMHPKKVGMLVAGWDVPHAHVHVVPMEDYHDITSKRFLEEKKTSPSSDDLEKTQHIIIT